jgi:hypothetical protein
LRGEKFFPTFVKMAGRSGPSPTIDNRGRTPDRLTLARDKAADKYDIETRMISSRMALDD